MLNAKNFTPIPVDRRTLRVLFQITWMIVAVVVVAYLRQMPLVLK
jgi:hypothetical protein